MKLQGLDYITNILQYFMDVFEKVFGLENEKVEDLYKEKGNLEDVNYNGSFKEIADNYIVEQFTTVAKFCSRFDINKS